jgi:hypothetical protein
MKFPKSTTDKPKLKLRVPKSDAITAKDKKTMALALTGKPSEPALEVLTTRFGSQSATIVDLISMGNSDGATSLIVKALLQSLVEVLPMAEQHIVASKTTKGVYGFNALITSVRELLGDLQALRDRSSLGQSIVDKTVRPSYMDIAVQVVSAFTIIQDSSRARMSEEDFREHRRTIEETKKGLSDYLTAQYKSVSDQVVKSLG